jgi:hypothetical protein
MLIFQASLKNCQRVVEPQSAYRGRGEIGGSVSLLSAGAFTTTLYVMVDIVKGAGRAPPHSPARADFTLMMECTPGKWPLPLCVLCR